MRSKLDSQQVQEALVIHRRYRELKDYQEGWQVADIRSNLGPRRVQPGTRFVALCALKPVPVSPASVKV